MFGCSEGLDTCPTVSKWAKIHRAFESRHPGVVSQQAKGSIEGGKSCQGVRDRPKYASLDGRDIRGSYFQPNDSRTWAVGVEPVPPVLGDNAKATLLF